MSNTNKCKSKSKSKCKTDQSKYTQVKTVYARVAIVLLAVNFCLTGYVLSSMMKMQEEPSVTTSTLPLSVPEALSKRVKEYTLTLEQVEDPAILEQLSLIRELVSEYVEKQNEILRKKHEDFLRYGDRPELPSKK